jgi:hypothetical protein
MLPSSQSAHEYSRAIPAERALKFVENAVIFVQVTKLSTEVVMDANGLHWTGVHIDVPDLQRKVVAREDVSTVLAEPDVRDRRNNLREERAVGWVLFFFEF